MATYLLAWNPKRWNWDDHDEISDEIKDGKEASIRWSCGNSKKLSKGDRVFFIRLGLEPKGIFASGNITKGSYEAVHWEKEKADIGEKTLYVQVELDAFLDPEKDPILPRELLSTPPFSGMHWDTQMSGIKIPDDIAFELEKVWANFSITTQLLLPEEITPTEAFFEGAKQQVLVNAYERNPEARRKCIAHYGTKCSICGFDFYERYGEEGRGLIHIHHLRQLAEIGEEYEVDPINDLLPVCPNCHAMIHRRKPAFTIDEVKELLASAKDARI